MSLPVPVVFARGTELVEMPNGARIRLTLGTHWPASDPIVRRRPDLFTRDSRFGMLYTEGRPEYDPSIVPPMDDDLDAIDDLLDDDEPEVDDPAMQDDAAAEPSDADRDSADSAEQATAAPGEQRDVRRRPGRPRKPVQPADLTSVE